ncbi:hypothetical protein BT93_A0439 [Corymbia citriodora subsp. variegata]|nr:hypothetical protein BT93_A0439 [Corymbia citriodora subsp. variegata]
MCKDGLVVSLDLSEESISGGINGSLEFLQSLNLAFKDSNSMAIPSGLANLSRLAHLLILCRISGQIFVQLSRLTKLRALDLSYLYYSGWSLLKLEKPNLRSLIGDLGELRELYLDGVNVSTEGCEWCNALSSSVPKLEVLSMHFCSLSGPINPLLMILANLSGSLPEFPKNGSLQTLLLSDTNMFGRLPDSIDNLKNLSTIKLENCNFDGKIPSSFANIFLDLQINLLEGNIPSSLFTYPSIGVLLLNNNRFSGQLKGSFDAPSHVLNIVDLSFNNIGGELPTSIWELRGLMGLLLHSNNFRDIPRWIWTLGNPFHLNLSSNLFEDFETPPNNLTSYLSIVSLHSNMLQGNMPPLPLYASHLDFSSNNLNSVIPDDIGNNLPNLMFFSLSKNNFHGFIPPSICKAGYLEMLNLSHNYLNGTIPDCLMEGQIPLLLANCATLDCMNMRDNQIDGTFPCHFESILNLRVLVLRSNKLHGEIKCPHSQSTCVTLKDQKLELIKIPTIFTSIDFSANRLEGPIPDTLGDLKALYVLNLLHNAILDLSRNYLNRTILAQLANPNFLSLLNLSDNQLVGNIPTSGHFFMFSTNQQTCSITMNTTEEVGGNGHNDDSEEKWFYMGIPFGFVIGFWIFCGPLVFMRSWSAIQTLKVMMIFPEFQLLNLRNSIWLFFSS